MIANRIRKAARYMEQHGKCEGVDRDYLGRVCMVGALGEARADKNYRFAHSQDLLTIKGFLGFPLFLECVGLAAFSDGNDQATVVETLKAAADWADGLFG